MTTALLAVWKAGSLSLIEEGYAVMIDELLGFGSCLALPERIGYLEFKQNLYLHTLLSTTW